MNGFFTHGQTSDARIWSLYCGMVSWSVSLSLTDLHIKETEDNEAVVSTVIDLHRLMKTKYLPAVQGWVQVGTNTEKWNVKLENNLWATASTVLTPEQ